MMLSTMYVRSVDRHSMTRRCLFIFSFDTFDLRLTKVFFSSCLPPPPPPPPSSERYFMRSTWTLRRPRALSRAAHRTTSRMASRKATAPRLVGLLRAANGTNHRRFQPKGGRQKRLTFPEFLRGQSFST